MASLQTIRVKGKTYYRLVTCRRINGKPTPVVLAYLGSANELLKRIEHSDEIKIRSWSHGAVAALYGLSNELNIAGIIDKQLSENGRRLRRPLRKQEKPSPQNNDGLSVGQSLVLAAIGRACFATSKRAFSQWASTTTLGQIAKVDIERLTSQHFWDQMDQLPVELIESIEKDLIADVVKRFDLPLDTLFYDATNFFTFISSSNSHCSIPARGKQKQKRSDLRQVSVAMLCSRQHGIPLWHRTYGGNVADSKCFADVFSSIRKRLVDMQRNIESLTIVYDKGNVSRSNQTLVDTPIDKSKLHYVAALTVASQRKLVDEANPHLAPIKINDGKTVPAYRMKREVWGAERTVVVLCSERLREGQIRGTMQHVVKAQNWLEKLSRTLQRGKQKCNRAQIERDIETRLKGRQHLNKVIRYSIAGEDPNLTLSYRFVQEAFDDLSNNTFGRLVLITDRHDWPTEDIICAYRGQSKVEAAFAHLKDPIHLALRPQRHWTDQKLHVHVFICVLGYLLASLLHLRARKANAPFSSIESLLDALARIRKAMILKPNISDTKGVGPQRISYQLEEIEPSLAPLLPVLGIIG